MGSYNHQMWVYWPSSGYQNLHTSRIVYDDDSNVSGKLKPGYLFWATGAATNPTLEEDCALEANDPDIHYWRSTNKIEGYFDLGLLKTRWAINHLMNGYCITGAHRHAQHASYCTCVNAGNCFVADFGQTYLPNRSMLFIDWIYAETINGNTQNFMRRVNNGLTYYGARVLYNNKSLKDANGNHIRYLNRNNWVWFTYSYPPATGATLHDHIRIRAYSLTNYGTMYFGSNVFFFDNDTNYRADMTWAEYNVATMPTGGPV
ncbi:hypothetical protein [Mahella australiensis]|uniref:Uncharacterized protein n=1 Tax=Mahella australiensis (strain DSM 15567 / CIP 107919 / 50-1 BON) TaxID=697281 RepID=F3ZVC3_MAHA5|nr:hypothetical protein [Mahella australiensis]AEE95273.1 hypothetical protein Mahau_0050 [Mahella australiensis 50-1 BON]